MKKAIQSLLVASLLTSPMAIAGSDEIRVTVNVANTSAPIQVINTSSYYGMEILEPACNNSACTFRVHTNNANNEYAYAAISIGRDAEHACTLAFAETYGFWRNTIKMYNKVCYGGWTSGDLNKGYITLSGN